MVVLDEKLVTWVGDFYSYICLLSLPQLSEAVHENMYWSWLEYGKPWMELAENLQQQSLVHEGVAKGLEGSFSSGAGKAVVGRIRDYAHWCETSRDAARITGNRIKRMSDAFEEMRKEVPAPDEIRHNRQQWEKLRKDGNSYANNGIGVAALEQEYNFWMHNSAIAMQQYRATVAKVVELPDFAEPPAPLVAQEVVGGFKYLGLNHSYGLPEGASMFSIDLGDPLVGEGESSWSQRVLDTLNSPFMWAFHRPLIGDGLNGVKPGDNGGAGGILWGNGGDGAGAGDGFDDIGGKGGSAGLWGNGGKGGAGGLYGLVAGDGGSGGLLFGHGGAGGDGFTAGNGGRAFLFGNGGSGGSGYQGGHAGGSGLLIGTGGNGGGLDQPGANGGFLFGDGGDGAERGAGGHAWLCGNGGNGMHAGSSGFFIGDGGDSTGLNNPGANGGVLFGNGGKGDGDGGRAWLFGHGGDSGPGNTNGGDGGFFYGNGGDALGSGNGGNAVLFGKGGSGRANGRDGLLSRADGVPPLSMDDFEIIHQDVFGDDSVFPGE